MVKTIVELQKYDSNASGSSSQGLKLHLCPSSFVRRCTKLSLCTGYTPERGHGKCIVDTLLPPSPYSRLLVAALSRLFNMSISLPKSQCPIQMTFIFFAICMRLYGSIRVKSDFYRLNLL